MKKIFLAFAMALCMLPALAQKHNLVVGSVTTVNTSWQYKVPMLKDCILRGLASTGRVDVVDGATLSGLSAQTGEAIAQLKQVGGDYLFEATLQSLSTSTETNKDGKLQYKATLIYSYKVYEVATGSMIDNAQIDRYGSSSKNTEEAINQCFVLVDDDMGKMTLKNFYIISEIKAVDETHPKTGVRSVYIGVGANDGVAPGNDFEVYKIFKIGEETTTKLIGALKVKEVKSGTLSLCKVTKGGKEIQQCLDEGAQIAVISVYKPDLFDIVDSIL